MSPKIKMALFLSTVTCLLGAVSTHTVGDAITYVTPFTRHTDITFGAANLGPTAPINLCNGSFCGLGFDADAEQADIIIDVPEGWIGTSDLTLTVTWTNQAADAIADTEDVDLEIEYRSIARTGETTSNGTAVTVAADYTQSGAGTDGELFTATFTIDFDNANQPITVDDLFMAMVTRDLTGETNSYSGNAILGLAELAFSSTNAVSGH